MCKPGKYSGGWVYLSLVVLGCILMYWCLCVLALVCILVYWCLGVARDRDFG